MLNAKKVYKVREILVYVVVYKCFFVQCPHDQCLWEFSCASKLRRHLGSHTKQKNHAVSLHTIIYSGMLVIGRTCF